MHWRIRELEQRGCDMRGAMRRFLEKNGFAVERGVGGLETAFRAVWQKGEGGPSFGLLCEYDALENIGHACGHHVLSLEKVDVGIVNADILDGIAKVFHVNLVN